MIESDCGSADEPHPGAGKKIRAALCPGSHKECVRIHYDISVKLTARKIGNPGKGFQNPFQERDLIVCCYPDHLFRLSLKGNKF